MSKFRKKPVVIEAVQWIGKNFDEIEEFVGGDAEFRDGELVVATLEGPLRASLNDWIIKGVKGEFYPCKPDVFAATYESEQAGASEGRQPEPSPASTSLHPVFAFLLGSGALDGVWFGADPPDGKPRYWWRNHLRDALSLTPSPTPVQGREEAIEALAEMIVRDVAELPDRTSPIDAPEIMLVTQEELFSVICGALKSSSLPRGRE